jgi:superfamily II DNA or RNA helicase
MQNWQSSPPDETGPHLRRGDLVQIRRQRWRVVDVRAYEGCRLLTLAGTGTANAGLERRLLVPFDAVVAVNRESPLRLVRAQPWRRACRALLAGHAPPSGLRAARLAQIDLLPHQLEPALALVLGRGSRVLLADDVGLGKTIQAGLIIAELTARGMAERVLILTPAGLRDQWAAELLARFGVRTAIVDFRDVRRRVADLPVGMNPWSTIPIAIASIDYVKRADVLRSVLACRWDVLVVDEAHRTAPEGERHAAVSALASVAAYVLLLTATPHNGDRGAFAALCRTGSHADPLLVFRRTKADVGLGNGRRVHRLHVRPGAAETRMHALLAEFSRAVRSEHRSEDVWLPLAVLHKRALSSAHSLALSVERRLAVLTPAGRGPLRQIDLPLTDPGGELDAHDQAPEWNPDLALADQSHERRLLRTLAEAARAAVAHESKLSAIARLVNRIEEPIVVFTEYRDTLLHLRDVLQRPVAILHGGLSREERAAALDQFASGGRQILLATDAAGEGLNLHHRCRTVINLELPWNPMRLEQRIGRIDRIGQRRIVHVFHLIARGTSESQVLERLKARIALARHDIGAANPVEDDERTIALAVIDGPIDEPLSAGAATRSAFDRLTVGDERVAVNLNAEACEEVGRLRLARALTDAGDDRALAALEATGTWITTAHLGSTRRRLGHRIVAIMRVDYEDGHGRVLHWALVSLAITVASLRRRFDRDQIRNMLRAIAGDLAISAQHAAAGQHDEIERLARACAGTRAARERAIAQAPPPLPLFQSGLFDRRADHAHLMNQAGANELADDVATRLRTCERGAAVVARAPRLMLVLAP